MSKHNKGKLPGEFKKSKQPSEYKLAQMGHGHNQPVNPNDQIGLNPHGKHRR